MRADDLWQTNRRAAHGLPAISAALARVAGYVWASPNTLLGLVAGFVMLCLGGRVRLVSGTVEFDHGRAGLLFAGFPAQYRFGALTLGHVILGVSQARLEALRAHERVHVRQYELWGPFFLPAYALSSLWQAVRGRRAYRDNFFEMQACAIAANLGGSERSNTNPMNSQNTEAI